MTCYDFAVFRECVCVCVCVCVCACVRAIASVCICAILHYGIHNIVISIIYEVSWYGANGIYLLSL